MKLWLIFVQGDDHTWLEAAWDDESTAQNHSAYQRDVDRVRKLAQAEGFEMRIIEAQVPGVYEAFEIPAVTART